MIEGMNHNNRLNTDDLIPNRGYDRSTLLSNCKEWTEGGKFVYLITPFILCSSSFVFVAVSCPFPFLAFVCLLEHLLVSEFYDLPFIRTVRS